MKSLFNTSLSLVQKRNYMGLLFVAPWIFGFLTLQLFPLVQSVVISVSQVRITAGGYALDPVGFGNYVRMLFVEPEYRPAVIETIVQVVTDVPLVIVFSIFAATLIQPVFIGRTLARSIFFLPVILSSGVVLRIQADDWLYELLQAALESTVSDGESETYLLAEFFRSSGAGEAIVGYLMDAVDRIKDIINASGVQILVFLAGLQSIPDSFYEASRIEGASSWEIFWKITVPILSPLIFANAVYTIIDSFTRYDNEIMRLVKEIAFGRSQYGLSAAMSWGYFVIIAFLLALLFTWAMKRVFYQG